ncbi:hypothetical protein BXQ17_03120 [Polaribacter sp. BM10]|uniref:DUF805 domain-containing protein n=1 Tax=Polaribacter sp. BM10 TaxID=1529069 RepID=UPI00098AD12A|nr:DUF805 domain-containing protein [Polaribacter sp. BM10]AQS93129.1 hypothetical protein BXQ17_03120 [Polaribacter sp. BM10]
MNWYLKVLKQYADFKGRARRKEYWMFVLINSIISFSLKFIMHGSLVSPETSLIETIYSIAVLLPYLAVGVRRMHDAGKSGWFLLIPFYNLYLACTDSENGENKWGSNPKGLGNSNEIDFIGNE